MFCDFISQIERKVLRKHEQLLYCVTSSVQPLRKSLERELNTFQGDDFTILRLKDKEGVKYWKKRRKTSIL